MCSHSHQVAMELVGQPRAETALHSQSMGASMSGAKRQRGASEGGRGSSGAGPSSKRPRLDGSWSFPWLGKYICEFVEKPPEILQSDCPICLSILHDPHQVACCGYSFCKTCIEQVRPNSKKCPTCNVEGFTTFSNKGLQRSLNLLKVRCPHKDNGCEWTGELGDLDKHLNEKPSDTSNFLHGCQYVEVECLYCAVPFQRCVAEHHQLSECPQRPYSCDHCGDYESSFEDVVNSHHLVCKCYPLQCPNNCELQPIERQNLEHHVSEECPLMVVECDFHYAGCGVMLPRKDLTNHLAESLVHHVSLLAVHGRKLERENTLLKERLCTHSHLHTPPVTFTMTSFEQHQKSKDTWYGPPFYTHPHGYKLCIKVTCKDSGLFVGANLMCGEFDDFLQWPFQSDVCIRILNQRSDDNHITFTGSFSADPTLNNAGRRVRVGEWQSSGRGCRFQYATLKDSTENCLTQYLRDDCIQLQVARVVDTLQLQREIVATIDHTSVRTPSCQFMMRDFEQHKRDGDFWYSPSFYTHPQGYRMCLGVVANGCYHDRGTHVSVYTYIMCGEFDSHLKWPFQGNITIQLLNQLESKHHLSRALACTEGDGIGRLTVGERDRGLGFSDFILLSELGLNHAKNRLYLKDDSLVFKIKKIGFKD